MHDGQTAMEDGSKIAEIEQLTAHEVFSSDYLRDSKDTDLIKPKYPVHFNSAIEAVGLPRLGE
jgi:hypothetical protein